MRADDSEYVLPDIVLSCMVVGFGVPFKMIGLIYALCFSVTGLLTADCRCSLLCFELFVITSEQVCVLN